MIPEQVIADVLECEPTVGNVQAIVAALRAAGLLPGPDDIVVSREALAHLIWHATPEGMLCSHCRSAIETFVGDLGAAVCHHCGKPPDLDGDHSCPCPYRDEECQAHPLRAALSQPHPEETP